MSQRPIPLTFEVAQNINCTALHFADKHCVSLFAMCNPRLKSGEAVDARGDLIEWIHESVVIDRHQNVAMRANVDTEDNIRGWHGLSLPMIGFILQQDHSTIQLARTRWNKKTREQQGTQETKGN